MLIDDLVLIAFIALGRFPLQESCPKQRCPATSRRMSVFSGVLLIVGCSCIFGYGALGSDEPLGLKRDKAASSCQWQDPPENGINLQSCSTGICRIQAGADSVNGSVRFTKCNKNFLLAEGYERDTCFNGRWTSSEHKCIECGRSQKVFNPDSEQTMVPSGHNSSRGDFPWMAALYLMMDEGRWEQYCGGTLISPSIVLSAAHCFSIAGRDLTPNKLKVGLGKLSADFYQEEPGAVISNVREVVKPARYVGADDLYALDIALVVLTQRVPTGRFIMPACLDWSASMKLMDGETGVVAGWGMSETGVRIITLNWNYRKYITFESCRAQIMTVRQKYVTHDKFCTTKVKVAKSDKGNGGAGLTVVRDGAHFLYGILSTSLIGHEEIGLFTNLQDGGHRDWLRQQWRRLQLQQSN